MQAGGASADCAAQLAGAHNKRVLELRCVCAGRARSLEHLSQTGCSKPLFATKELVLCQANLQFEPPCCAETGTLSGDNPMVAPSPGHVVARIELRPVDDCIFLREECLS